MGSEFGKKYDGKKEINNYVKKLQSNLTPSKLFIFYRPHCPLSARASIILTNLQLRAERGTGGEVRPALHPVRLSGCARDALRPPKDQNEIFQHLKSLARKNELGGKI